MGRKQIVIIGGGLAGLAAGIYAQQNGFDTIIFEHHSVPGGVCTAWKRQGYTVDGCIHWLMGALPGMDLHQIYGEVGVLEDEPLIPISHFARFLDPETGETLHFTSDLERTEAEMLEISPRDKPMIQSFIRSVRAVEGFPLGFLKSPELLGFGEKMKLWAKMARYLPTMARSMKRVNAYASQFKSSALQRFLPRLFVPEMPLAFGLVLLSELRAGALAGYRGGSRVFAERMASRYRALGGDLRLKSRVTRILVKGESAVGVELADGTQFKADIVVSAADGHSTIFDLLGGSFLNDQIRQLYGRGVRFEPISIVTFGVANTLGSGDPGTVLMLGKPLSASGRATNGLHYRTFHHDPGLAPEGHALVQAMVESEWDYWNNLSKDRPAYEAAKQNLARQIAEKLAPQLPGLDGNIEMTDVATPYTTWRYTLNEHGYYEAFIATPELIRNPPPKTLPGLSNFYMAGQWVEPGGGIPPALAGSRHLVMKLCRQEGRSFEAQK